MSSSLARPTRNGQDRAEEVRPEEASIDDGSHRAGHRLDHARTYTIIVRVSRTPTDVEIGILAARDSGARVSRGPAPETLRFSCDTESLAVAIGRALENLTAVHALHMLWVDPAD